MANNYCESSSFLDIPKDKLKQAEEILDRVTLEIAKSEMIVAGLDPDDRGDEDLDDWGPGCLAELEDSGVWFHADESLNPDHVELFAKALIDELEIDEPFVFSWAYTCSKPRIDEFGGGACVVRRGRESIWVDAVSTALEMHREESIGEVLGDE